MHKFADIMKRSSLNEDGMRYIKEEWNNGIKIMYKCQENGKWQMVAVIGARSIGEPVQVP